MTQGWYGCNAHRLAFYDRAGQALPSARHCCKLCRVPQVNQHQAHVITSFNLKGGVGKTHVCWLIASVCQERSHRCLIVDLDQQANITQSFLPDHNEPSGVERLFDPNDNAEPRDLVRQTAYPHIDMIPVTGHFAGLDLSQPGQWKTQRLQAALADAVTDLLPDYDYILLDCPPRMSLASYAALCASDFVIIPLEAADWGARGTAGVRAVVQRVQRHDNPRLKLLGYVVSKFKRSRSFQLTYLTQIRQSFGDQVFQTAIPDLARFERSVDEGIPITLHSPSSHAAGVARQFFDEFTARIAKEHDASRGREGSIRHQSGAAAHV